MSCATNLDKRLVETLKFWMLELGIVEAEEVIHDDIASECWKCICEIERFLAGFEFLHADGQRVDVPVDDVDEVEDGAAGEPAILDLLMNESIT
jgi:hypothetical protein